MSEKAVSHIAGKYSDGVQQCSRCLKILVDDRGSESSDCQWTAFPEGVLSERPGWPICFSVGVDPNAVECKPMLEEV